jgi:hypothetical protein
MPARVQTRASSVPAPNVITRIIEAGVDLTARAVPIAKRPGVYFLIHYATAVCGAKSLRQRPGDGAPTRELLQKY